MSKPISSLIPGIESRLSGWATIQARLAQVPERRIRPTITLSRTFGCEGYPLAEALKARLEAVTGEPWILFDKVLIETVAQEEGLPLSLLKNLGDGGEKLDALGFLPQGRVTHDEAFEKVAKYLVQISHIGNAIVVGRGGAVLCRALSNCYHFRLDAPLDFRVASVVKRLEMTQAEAEQHVKEGSRLREAFLNDRLGTHMADPTHYHAVFNNALQPVEVIADAIVAYVRAAWPERALFKP